MENYLVFLVMALLLIILPGPDTAIATKNTLSYGKSEGLKTSLGTLTAIMIHTLAAVIGISAIIVKSAFMFSVIKYVGALYLIYLGIKSILSLRRIKVAEEKIDTKHIALQKKINCFREGFLTNLLNPKVAVFFLTFLPQFIDPGDNAVIKFFILGITYSVLTGIWFTLYVYLIHFLHAFMKKPSTQFVTEAITGSVLMGFGIKLALTQKH